MKKVFISPSLQSSNLYAGGLGNEKQRMNEIADKLVAILKEYQSLEVKRSNKNGTLQQAVADSNKFNPDLHLALHSNAGGGKGYEIYCIKGGKAEQAAKIFDDVLSGVVPFGRRGIKDGSKLYECNSTKAPAVLVEIAFHDDVTQAKWIVDNEDKIAQAYAKAILTFFGIPVKEPQQPAQPANELYKVQVGAFSKKDNAQALADKLKKEGYQVWITKN